MKTLEALMTYTEHAVITVKGCVTYVPLVKGGWVREWEEEPCILRARYPRFPAIPAYGDVDARTLRNELRYWQTVEPVTVRDW